jgi:hypothetical protein
MNSRAPKISPPPNRRSGCHRHGWYVLENREGPPQTKSAGKNFLRLPYCAKCIGLRHLSALWPSGNAISQ